MGGRYILDRMLFDLIWGFTFEEDNIPIEKIQVCGHQFKHHKQPRLFKNRAFIDTGCGYGDKPLTAVEFPKKLVFQCL